MIHQTLVEKYNADLVKSILEKLEVYAAENNITIYDAIRLFADSIELQEAQ